MGRETSKNRKTTAQTRNGGLEKRQENEKRQNIENDDKVKNDRKENNNKVKNERRENDIANKMTIDSWKRVLK